MNVHPSILMIRVWLFCAALLVALPFQFVSRQMTVFGFAVLAAFIATFCVGAFVASPVQHREAPSPDARINLDRVDRILVPVAIAAVALLLFDLVQQGFGDLSASFEERNDRATALMTGSGEGGGIFFQLGFLLYPAGYIYLARQIIYEDRPSLWRIALYGFGPSLLAALTTGGRGSLLYALAVTLVSFRARQQLWADDQPARPKRQRNWFLLAVLAVAALASLNYFVQVFVVRSAGFGGIEGAYDHAARDWGVSFEGGRYQFLRTVLGDGNTYLLFLFSWYAVQSLVIANELFTYYDGPYGFGVYGIDLITAVLRRFDGDFVARRFLGLLDLNIYGFLPSAYGSFFVDFRYFTLPILFGWGYAAGLVYRGARQARDLRWILAAPFVTLGIVFSVLNTPLGFNNGLVTHFWLVVALLASQTTAATALATAPERA